MERDSSPHGGSRGSGAGTGSASSPVAADQQEQLRQALLSAADEEAAAIVEQARRDITVAVRRARRDLHLVRAQLQLCGVEMPSHSAAASLEDGHSSLDEGVPRDAIAVRRPDSLRHVVTEASQELAQLSAGVSAAGPSTAVRDTVHTASFTSPEEVTRPPARKRSTVLIAACALLGIVAGGAAGWMFMGREDRVDAAESSSATAPRESASDRGPASEPRTDAAAPRTATTPPPTAVPSSRVMVQTIRPVWMRIDIDGSADVGRLYPEGTTRELAPTRDVVIRAGDAGAVLVGIGGASPTPLGQSGQVLTRRIPVDQSREPSPVKTGGALAPDGEAREISGTLSTASIRTASTPIETASSATVQPNPTAANVQRPEGAGQSLAVNGPATGQTHAEILAKHQRWLDAYSRGDTQVIRTLTTDGFSLLDERSAAEKNATAQEPEVSEVRIDVAGVGAVLTGRLRTMIQGVLNEAMLSEVWVRDGQQRWALMGVRITPVVPAPVANR